MLSNNSNSQNINNPNSADDKTRDSIDLNLTEYILKVKRRWKPALAIFLLTVGTTGFLSLLQKKTYHAEGKLLFKQQTAASLTGVGDKVGNLEPLLVNQTPLSTQIEVITSEPVLQQVIDRQKLQDDKGEPLKPEDLKRKLKIELIGGSDVIQLGYKHPDAKVASKIVNTLMDVYVQEQIRSNQSQPATAKEFINKQLPSMETQVGNAESSLESFRTQNGIVDLAEEKRTLVTDLGTLNQQISTTGSQLQGIQSQTSALQGQLGLDLKQAVSANQLGASPVVKSILDQLAQTETQLSKERQRFNDKHPSIVSLEEKKTNLNNQLGQLIATTVGKDVEVSQGLLQSDGGLKENPLEKFITLKIDELSMQRQVGALYQYQQSYLQRAKALPKLEKKEKELIRTAESASKTYTTLLDSLQQVQLAENEQSGNADIVEYAAIPDTGSSGRVPLLALGVILGAFLANLSVILLEMQDRTLQSIVEIKRKFAYNTIGITPLEPPHYQGRIITQEEPDSFSSEVYRMIQANLKFLTNDKPPKVILVTSSVPEEGKSTVTANLAAAIAQLGRRVLLIDGDLRRSSQHRLWGVDNRIGLKDVLTENKSLMSVISQPMPKLDLLTSGVVRSNPLALLDSQEMSDLVGSSRREYDLILIDAPPLPVTADVLTLSKLVDGILFVTRPGIVEHESAELAQETLATTRQQVLGMVINGVKPSDFDRYSYHGRYGKSYFNTNNQEPGNLAGSEDLNKDLNNVPEGNTTNGSISKARI